MTWVLARRGPGWRGPGPALVLVRPAPLGPAPGLGRLEQDDGDAARVVRLVGTSQVAPEQVLGLTFTNKAAGELAERVRTALVRAGVTDPDVIDPDNPPGEPVISTYHAFAGRLLTDHGLRIGLEPTARLLTDHGLRIGLEPTARLLADATRYQLAARVLREAPGPYPSLTRSFTDQVTGPDAGLDSPEPRSGLGPEAVLAGSGVGGDAARVPA